MENPKEKNTTQESANAPNRALKRRVRQRLHKKLGAILSLEEFERAKEQGQKTKSDERALSALVPKALFGCVFLISGFSMF